MLYDKISDRDLSQKAIDSLEAGGATAGAAGINTAYEIAEKHFIEGGNNRIILLHVSIADYSIVRSHTFLLCGFDTHIHSS